MVVRSVDHRNAFLDFVAGVRDVGGNPLEVLAAMPDLLGRTDPRDKAWLAGCYGATYSVHGASLIWSQWPLIRDPEVLPSWVGAYRTPVRKERFRTHGNPGKLAEGLLSARGWALGTDIEQHDYERLWEQVRRIDHTGRYFGIKTCGALRWLGLTGARQTDVRPRGARLGRKTLGMLHPKIVVHGGADAKRNNPHAIEWATFAAEATMKELAGAGLRVGYFELESLLCEYQQMLNGKLHPGKALGMDLADLEWLSERYGASNEAVVAGRMARERVLREDSWRGPVRAELDTVLRDFSYVWSDSFYDWQATRDLRDPVARSSRSWEPRARPCG